MALSLIEVPTIGTQCDSLLSAIPGFLTLCPTQRKNFKRGAAT